MRVALKQEVDPRSPGICGWVKPGREYVVLAVEQISSAAAGYRIASEDGGGQPVLFEVGIFDVVDRALPSCWIVLGVRGATVELGPRQFGVEGFWERLFDRDSEAQRLYAEAKEEVEADS